MEDFNSLDSGFRSGGVVTALSGEDKTNLSLAAYWAKFLGIMGYIVSALIALGSIGLMVGMGAMGTLLMGGGGMPTGFFAIIGVVYLGLAFLGFYIARALYNFGKKTQTALANNSDSDLTAGLVGLKSFFRTYGIIAAIFVALYGIMLLFLLGGLLFSAAR